LSPELGHDERRQSKLARIAMIAITTSNSINVNRALCFARESVRNIVPRLNIPCFDHRLVGFAF